MLLVKGRHDPRDVSLREVEPQRKGRHDLRDLSTREVEAQRKGYVSFKGGKKIIFSSEPGGFLDWLLFKNGIRKQTRLRVRSKGKNQAGGEGNTIDPRRFLRPCGTREHLVKIKNSGDRIHTEEKQAHGKER